MKLKPIKGKGGKMTAMTLANAARWAIIGSTTWTVAQLYRYGGVSGYVGSIFPDMLSSFLKGGIKGFDAEGVSQEVSELVKKLIKGADLGGISREASEALKKAMEEGKLDELSKEASDKIRDAVNAFDSESILEGWSTHINQFRNFTETHGTEWIRLGADFLKQATTSYLPWVALTSVVLVGTPLLLGYAYYYAIENIGMPKLIQERKSYTWYARAKDAALGTLSWCYENSSSYLKTNLFTYGSVLGTTIFTNAVFRTFDSFGAFSQESWAYQSFKNNVVDPFSNLNRDFSCTLAGGTVETCVASKSQYLSLENLATLSALLAFSGVAYSNMKALYKYFVNSDHSESKPIFSEKIQSRVDEITSSLSNLKKHGGFLPNVLLYGPGGTGKTMIAKYIARNSGTNYVMMSGGDLAQFIRKGQHVTKLNELIEWINKQPEPTVLFIDECEALCKNRSRVTRPEDLELVNTFLNHTGEASKKLMLIMATNDKDLDPAVLSRCDYKLAILPPEQPERVKIINKYAQVFFTRKELKNFFSEEQVVEMAQKTQGLTGRALFKMLNAINNKKKSTRTNVLTQVLIDDTVRNFIEQEKELEAYAQQANRPVFSQVPGLESDDSSLPDVTLLSKKPKTAPVA